MLAEALKPSPSAALAAGIATGGRDGACALTALDLSDTQIGTQGAAMVAGGLKRNSTLTSLLLAGNAMGAAGAGALAAMDASLRLGEVGLGSPRGPDRSSTHGEKRAREAELRPRDYALFPRGAVFSFVLARFSSCFKIVKTPNQ